MDALDNDALRSSGSEDGDLSLDSNGEDRGPDPMIYRLLERQDWEACLREIPRGLSSIP
jgi:hypothetical protein